MTDTTHAPGCWSWGPRHYECAVREIERLRKMHQDAYQRGLQAGSNGLREMYDAMQTVKRQDAWGNAQLTEALMEAEERAKRAEAENKQLRAEVDTLKAENERLRTEEERFRTDGASAVRWAPGSAYWSDVLRGLFGPDARKGIDALETRWREERERDEALLRQALEALDSDHSDVQLRAAIALRERLGEKA